MKRNKEIIIKKSYQDILKMYYFENLSIKEISRIMSIGGIGEEAVRVRLHRAIHCLVKKMGIIQKDGSTPEKKD